MVKNSNRKACILIDMSVSAYNDISVKEYNKISKYKDLEMEIEQIYHVKITTVPVIMGALDMVKRRQLYTLTRY